MANEQVLSQSSLPFVSSKITRGKRSNALSKNRRAAFTSVSNTAVGHSHSAHATVDLIEELFGNQLECSICTELIYSNSLTLNCLDAKGKRIPYDTVWICTKGCQTYFHAKCMTEWSKKCHSTINGSNSQIHSNISGASTRSNNSKGHIKSVPLTVCWTCPHCRLSYQGVMPTEKNAFCYCGKSLQVHANENLFKLYNSLLPNIVKDNDEMTKLKYRLIPYSCQRRCRKIAANGLCPHECNSICHPGPCPPCEKWIQGKGKCYCGKQEIPKYLCRSLPDLKYHGNDFSCGKLCKFVLPCDQWMHQLLLSKDIDAFLSSGQFSFFANGRQCSLKQARNWHHTCQRVCHSMIPEAISTSTNSLVSSGVSLDTVEKKCNPKNRAVASMTENNAPGYVDHGQCGLSIVGYCPCPIRNRIVISCGQNLYMKYKSVNFFSELFICTNVCNGVYLCGIHSCEQVCCRLSERLPHDKEVCPLEFFNAEKLELCRCGNHRLRPILNSHPHHLDVLSNGNADKYSNYLATRCLSFIPANCTDVCSSIRPDCGHICGVVCCPYHSKLGLKVGLNFQSMSSACISDYSKCSVKNFEIMSPDRSIVAISPESKCQFKVQQFCNCGRSSRNISCHESSAESFRAFSCTEICNIRLFCGRHRCQQVCCGLHSIKNVEQRNKIINDQIISDNSLDALLNEWYYRLGDSSQCIPSQPSSSIPFSSVAGRNASPADSFRTPPLVSQNAFGRSKRRVYKPLITGLVEPRQQLSGSNADSFDRSNSFPSTLLGPEPAVSSFSTLSMVDILKPLLSAFPERACQMECTRLLPCGKHRCLFPCHPFGLSGNDILSLPLPSTMPDEGYSGLDEIKSLDVPELIIDKLNHINIEPSASNSDAIAMISSGSPIIPRTTNTKTQIIKKCRMTTLVIRGRCPAACLEGADYLNSYICPCGKTAVEPPLPCNFIPPICPNLCPRSYNKCVNNIGSRSDATPASSELVAKSDQLQNVPFFCPRGHLQQYMEHRCHSRDIPCPYPAYCPTRLERICKCKAALSVGPIMSCGFIPLQQYELLETNTNDNNCNAADYKIKKELSSLSPQSSKYANMDQIIIDIPCKTECAELLYPCSHPCGRTCCSLHNLSSSVCSISPSKNEHSLQMHPIQDMQPEYLNSISDESIPKNFSTDYIPCLQRCSLKGMLSCRLHICQELCHISSSVACSGLPCHQTLKLHLLCPCGENNQIIPLTCSAFSAKYPEIYQELFQNHTPVVVDNVIGQRSEGHLQLLMPSSCTISTSINLPLSKDCLVASGALTCDSNCLKAQRLNALLSVSKPSESDRLNAPGVNEENIVLNSSAFPAELEDHSTLMSCTRNPIMPAVPSQSSHPLPFNANTLQYVYDRPNWTRSLISILYLYLEMNESQFNLHPLLLARPDSASPLTLRSDASLPLASPSPNISEKYQMLSSHHIFLISTWTPYQGSYQVGNPLSSFSKRPFIDFRKPVSGKAHKRQMIESIVNGINKGIVYIFETFSGPSSANLYGKDNWNCPNLNPNYPILKYEEIDREPFKSIRIWKEWKQEPMSNGKANHPIDEREEPLVYTEPYTCSSVKSHLVSAQSDFYAIVRPRVLPDMDLYYLLKHVSLSSLLQRFRSPEYNVKEETNNSTGTPKTLNEFKDNDSLSNLTSHLSSPPGLQKSAPILSSSDSSFTLLSSTDNDDEGADDNEFEKMT